MRQDEIARSHLTMARQRQRTLGVLLAEDAHSVVVDFLPTEQYTSDDAGGAAADAESVLAVAAWFIEGK